MNGFTAADMSTAAANGHADGYQVGYADAVKAVQASKDAAAPAMESIGNRKISLLQGDGFIVNGVSIFNPDTGRRGLVDYLGYVGWVASTPEAPRIDLEQFQDCVTTTRLVALTAFANALHRGAERAAEDAKRDIDECDRLLAVIDASPKDGSTDAKDAARYRWLKAERIQLWRDTLTGAPVSCSFDFDEPGHDVDAAIDAAMQATSAEVGE